MKQCQSKIVKVEKNKENLGVDFHNGVSDIQVPGGWFAQDFVQVKQIQILYTSQPASSLKILICEFQ